MTKPTQEDKVRAIDILDMLIDRYFETDYYYDESAGVIAEIRRYQKQLQRRSSNIQNPQPKRARQPKAEHVGRKDTPQPLIVVDTPTGLQITAGSKLKTGRNNR